MPLLLVLLLLLFSSLVFSCQRNFPVPFIFHSPQLFNVVVAAVLTPFIYLCKFTNNYVLSPGTGTGTGKRVFTIYTCPKMNFTSHLHNKRIAHGFAMDFPAGYLGFLVAYLHRKRSKIIGETAGNYRV